MKSKIFFLIFFVMAVQSGFSQNASTYFPASTGYKWYYTNTPLDSLNNPVTNQTRYRIDSFAVVADYKGLLASIVRVKDNLLSFTQNTPYNDTNHYNFQGTNGWKYLNISIIPDTTFIPGLINFFRSMENWYSVFRFANTVGTEYTLVSKDTTISYDTLSIPIRAKIKAKRLADENVSTVNGVYSAKKFVTIFGIYYRFLIFEYPIIERPDTTWIAQNVWMVKEVIPSVNVNLNTVGINYAFNVPGNRYELAAPVSVNNISSEIPNKFSLSQNYPNPFNPKTVIRFSLSVANVTSLKIYDILGKEIATLVNEKLQPGTYETSFDGSNLTSGVYFYKLTIADFTETKQMLLIK